MLRDEVARCRARLVVHGFHRVAEEPALDLEILHRPPRAGVLARGAAHTCGLLEGHGSTAAELLDQILAAGRAIDRAILGRTADEAVRYPVLQALAAVVPRPGRHAGRHEIALLFVTDTIPDWAAAVLAGGIRDHRRRCLVPLMRGHADGRLCAPDTPTPRPAAIVASMRAMLADRGGPPPTAQDPSA